MDSFSERVMQLRQKVQLWLKHGLKKKVIVVGIELLIALIFFVGADWAGDSVHRFFHSYFAAIALPFGFYFLLILVEERQQVLDFAMYATGVLLAALIDTQVISRYYRKMHTNTPATN
jgi:hypothetical protein